MKHELYTPSRCTSKLPDDLEKEYLISEVKYDGSRYLLYLNGCPYERNKRTLHTLLSRGASKIDYKFVDKSLNAPHITDLEYFGLEGTVLDGEIDQVAFPSYPSQEESGSFVKYYVFDIICFRGKDVRGLPLSQRRKILEEVVSRMKNPNVIPMQQFPCNHEEVFNKLVADGGEGIIIKDLRQGYGCGWAKMKKSTDISCVITGYKEGNGKYSGMIGALAISVYKDGKLLEVGFASGMNDKLRAEMTKNFALYLGSVVDVFAQEISKDNRLRHPTFHRIREDVSPEECTLEKLKADFKKKTMFTREK